MANLNVNGQFLSLPIHRFWFFYSGERPSLFATFTTMVHEWPNFGLRQFKIYVGAGCKRGLGSVLNKDKGLFKIRVLRQTFGQFHNGKGSVPLRLTHEITNVTPNWCLKLTML